MDSLGYDKENNTFIIIEYKNIKNNSLVDQGYSYLALMLERKEAFVLKYNNVTKSNLEIGDIDWSQSVADIDKQLYKKYGLTQEEIDYIEATIKPMDWYTKTMNIP